MENKIRVTKQFKFETGHALYGYDGLCKNVHGHSYKLDVTVIGVPIDEPENVKNGMVIDFGDLKAIVNQEIVYPFDHATVLNCNSPHKELANDMEEKGNKIIVKKNFFKVKNRISIQKATVNKTLKLVDKII